MTAANRYRTIPKSMTNNNNYPLKEWHLEMLASVGLFVSVSAQENLTTATNDTAGILGNQTGGNETQAGPLQPLEDTSGGGLGS
jgi:hypothetical protein